jgi:hypothetical protein
MGEDSEEHFEGQQFMIKSLSDVILIAKILLTFLSRIDWEALNKFYKFGNLPRLDSQSNKRFKRRTATLPVGIGPIQKGGRVKTFSIIIQ